MRRVEHPSRIRWSGATFQDVFPFGEFETASVNHVAVWQNAPADTFPAVIYVLGDSAMALSFDGGVNWLQDQSTLPPKIGGATNQVANGNTPKVMVISLRCVLKSMSLKMPQPASRTRSIGEIIHGLSARNNRAGNR